MKRSQIESDLVYLNSPISPKGLDHWALIDDYKNGMSYRKLAIKYSLSEGAVQRRVHAEGVTPRISRSLAILNKIKQRKFAREQKQIAEYIAANPNKAIEQPKGYSKTLFRVL